MPERQKPLQFSFQVAGQRITVRVEESEDGSPPAVAAKSDRRPAIEEAILRVAPPPSAPIPVKQLARLARRKYGPYLRAAVKSLLNKGELKRWPNNDVSLP